MMLDVSYNEIKGEIIPPPSKSFSQRYILMASFLPGKKVIWPVGLSDDEKTAEGIARSCGMSVKRDGESITIEGNFHCPERLDCGESGTAFRLIMGMLSSRRCKTAVDVSGRLAQRPLAPLLESLSPHGFIVERNGNSFMVDATIFSSGEPFVVNPRESSQFVSALMMALSLQKGGGIIEMNGIPSSGGYIRITSEILRNLGVQSEFNANRIKISGKLKQMEGTYCNERDFSSSAILISLGLLCSTDGIRITGLPSSGLQPDSKILDILKDVININKFGDEIEISCRKVDDIPYFEVDVDKTPDLAPALSIIGMFSPNGVGLLNPDRLNLKESKRFDAILEIAKKLNSIVERTEDLITIKMGKLPDKFHPRDYHDHRMSMAQFVACAALMRKFSFPYTGDMDKSFPGFLPEMEKCGFHINRLD